MPRAKLLTGILMGTALLGTALVALVKAAFTSSSAFFIEAAANTVSVLSCAAKP